jgi:hypothetical protein
LNLGLNPGAVSLRVAVTGTFCPAVAAARVAKEMAGQKRGGVGVGGGVTKLGGHTTQARHIAVTLREPQAGPVLTVTMAS